MSKFSKKDAIYLSVIVILLLTIAGMKFMPQKPPEPITYNYIGDVAFYEDVVAPSPSPEVTGEDEEAPEPSPSASAANSAKPAASPTKIKAGDAKININTASQLQLTRLPGIGDATAKKIIEYRDANGRFKAIKDIMKVSGIGEKKYDALKDLIEVD